MGKQAASIAKPGLQKGAWYSEKTAAFIGKNPNGEKKMFKLRLRKFTDDESREVGVQHERLMRFMAGEAVGTLRRRLIKTARPLRRRVTPPRGAIFTHVAPRRQEDLSMK